MTGVAFNAREAAVSETARRPAFLEFPRIVPSSSMTWIPWWISSIRIRKTLTIPAETTAAKGTRRVRIVRVVGWRLRRRGTRELSPSAREQETVVAMRYEVLSCLLVKGVDLFAFDELMATYCQKSIPGKVTLTD